jgi:hypothetical protein
MERVTDIFDQEIQAGDDSSGDLDTDLVNASLVLQKVAADEGIDLSLLSDEDVAGLLVDMLPKEKTAHLSNVEPEPKEESQNMSTPNEITVADVAAELAKVASAEGIDLNEVSREEYHEAFNALAAQMSDPSYVEQAEKVAEARAYGAQMAEGFLEKLALTEDEKTFHRVRMQQNMAGHSETNPLRHGAKDVSKAKAEERLARIKSNTGPMAKLQRGVDSAKLKASLGAKELTAAVKRNPRTAAAIGAGTLLAAGGTGMALANRSKEAFDEAAYEMAANFLLENGIDPSTGEKLASDEDLIASRAVEILREAGYDV